MAARLEIEIEEIPDGLLIRSVRSGSALYALLSAVVTGAVVFFFARMYFHRPALLVLTVLAATWVSSRWWRTVRVELRMTEVEMQVIGHLRSGHSLNRHIPLANIRRLEYQPGLGENQADRPGGLYVEQRWKSDCVLPHLDERQTKQAIDAIYQRFPMIPISPQQRERDLFGLDPIKLNLKSSGKANSIPNP
jgi:hypothetical protein